MLLLLCVGAVFFCAAFLLGRLVRAGYFQKPEVSVCYRLWHIHVMVFIDRTLCSRSRW